MLARLLHLVAAVAALAPTAAALGLDPQAVVATMPLAPEAPWSTEVVTVRAEEPGPTVLIVGGVHGDEPAGALAAEQIAGWTPTRGTLIVVPRANEAALAAGERRSPEGAEGTGDERDLNRCFPMAADQDPDGELCAALWALVEEHEPDYLLDLHEGYHFARLQPRSVGSSIISDASPQSLARAAAMVASIDETITDAQKKFIVKQTAVAGSLARAANEVLGIPSMILETTKKDQAVAYRVRQHRILVATFLTLVDMLDHGPDVLVGSAAGPDDVRVAMYVSAGVAGSGPDALERILEAEGGFVVRRVCATDLRAGVLEQFDAVVFPGGSASKQARSIREEGRERVRAFVEAGGGYLGICAGAYLAANNYEWSLDILDADVIDREHWARGSGEVELELTGYGRNRLRTDADGIEVRYHNGPIYARSRDTDIPNFRVLAWYRSEVRKEGVPGGVMIDTPALVEGRYGEGRVVASSPHLELSAGHEDLVRDLVRLAADAPRSR